MSEIILVLCAWCFVGMGILLAQSTIRASPETTMIQLRGSAADSSTLVQDVLQERVPLKAESTVTESTVVQHEERPFRRKPKKNVLVDSSLVIVIAALIVVAAFLMAWIKRRYGLRGSSLGSVTAFDTSGSLEIENVFADDQFDTPSEEAREKSCRLN
jgi:hypothetical protein